MARVEIVLDVMKDVSLGHEVFRGSTEAGALQRASWIDFHDPISNPLGYQRPFDKRRSQRAADYAETTADGFWPECILAIRSNDEVEEPDEIVHWEFEPIQGSAGRFGKLTVIYDAALTTMVNDELEPWRRAFSQVDCQHRLGSMGNSRRQVTFCIFPELRREQEATIFRTINARQRRISTSLVDAIRRVTDPNAPVHLKWAWALGEDPASPFNRCVYTGGRTPREFLINLAGLRQALGILTPVSLLRDEADWYPFVCNYWRVIEKWWPVEFLDRQGYKLQSSPGIRGLAQWGQHIFRAVRDLQDMNQATIERYFGRPEEINWRNDGPFARATGKGGQLDVYNGLVARFGIPGAR